ncbi:hypothetical protein ACIBEK_05990 [Nocardia fusca]|uniref:hypothetical protein n=1 Tax=Nocardia fusca TaxID=941183 RepID=UPI00378B9572
MAKGDVVAIMRSADSVHLRYFLGVLWLGAVVAPLILIGMPLGEYWWLDDLAAPAPDPTETYRRTAMIFVAMIATYGSRCPAGSLP